MNDYIILCQRNPQPSVIPDFCKSGFLFNEYEHLRQQSTQPFYVLTALNQRTKKAEARCAFFLDGDKALSPKAAPFGSIEFAETLPDAVLDIFLASLIEAVQSIGSIATLRIVNYPHCYAPEQAARLAIKLPQHDFQLIETNQTFYLSVSAENFSHSLIPAERRRLRKCRDAGFRFTHWLAPNTTDVVDFIQRTRQQQGYPLTICPTNLTSLLQKFPDRFLVFTVSDGPILVALTVAVRVREDLLYTFLPATHSDYRTFSPMVMLTDGVYTYCQQQGIELLDLGTALDEHNQPKPNLIRFKRNLGAQESPKLVFEKRF